MPRASRTNRIAELRANLLRTAAWSLAATLCALCLAIAAWRYWITPTGSLEPLAWLAIGFAVAGAALVARRIGGPNFSVEPARRGASTTVAVNSSDRSFDQEASQQYSRWTDEAGCERIAGRIAERIEPGQRHVALHVAFCPPLERLPEFECEQVAGPEAELSVGLVETFGVRIDARLRQMAEKEERIAVEYEVRSTKY